jgi:hypothetical protein
VSESIPAQNRVMAVKQIKILLSLAKVTMIATEKEWSISKTLAKLIKKGLEKWQSENSNQ